MNKVYGLTVLLFFNVQIGHADEHVTILDPSIPSSATTGMGEASRPGDIHLLKGNERDKLFQELGLAEDVREMDALARDLLYMRAGRFPLKKLAGTYPDVPEKKLLALRRAVLERESKLLEAKEKK